MDPVYQPLPLKKEPETSYRPVLEHSPSSGEHNLPYTSKPRRHRPARIFFHWLWHVLSFLWLAPIGTLLYLNFSRHVIGASAWCPRGNCNAEINGANAIERAKQFDRQDHDLNGALQFVAKALEVWFAFVATSLIYDMGILFARGGRGLPVGYLMSHLEFSDIRYILNPLLWTSPLPHRNSTPEKRARVIKLYIFAFTTALLTILANLMGPATAVLVLPTLQWIETPHVRRQTFNRIGLDFQPIGDNVLSGCDSSQLLARNYSCTRTVYGPILDQWAAQGLASTTQANTSDGEIVVGASQEASLQFLLNATNENDIIWIANRQVLRNMSHEYRKASGYLAEDHPPEYPDRLVNNSLQTILHQQGPSLGVQIGCHVGNTTDLTLADGRWVRCYTNWYLAENATYTKCLRLGLGNTDTKYYSQFYLQNVQKDSERPKTGVGVYYADKAMYYNDTEDFGSGIRDCVNNDTAYLCDWDKIFSTPLPIELRNTSTNVGVISYGIPGENNTDARVYCDHVTYLSFPTYSVDTSTRSNPQNLVILNNLPQIQDDAIPLAVHPDWFLAAWSVDREMALDGNRQIVKELKRVLPSIYDGSSSEADLYEFLLMHIYALGQSLSMVNFYWDEPAAAPASKQARAAEDRDNLHPVFHTFATIHVWAYGLSGRTSKLGVAVVGLGSVLVLLRVALGIFTGVQERSTVEVLRAAFEHRHEGEFDGLEEESHLAKVRYQVVDDGNGKQKFLPEKRTSRWSHAMSS
ncbi:MAG: hypothetical protein Q9201_007477 [Fulgogasparrea decipioides]